MTESSRIRMLGYRLTRRYDAETCVASQGPESHSLAMRLQPPSAPVGGRFVVFVFERQEGAHVPDIEDFTVRGGHTNRTPLASDGKEDTP